MADWPLLGDGQKWGGGNLSASRGLNVTPSATANTKGSYAQLVASTGVDASHLLITLNAVAGIDYLVDIAVGASGSEVVLVPNLFAGGGLTVRQSFNYVLPLYVPTGTRIAARCQASSASAGTLFGSQMICGTGMVPSSPLTRVTDYGPNTGTSGGVSVDPGGTLNTKGSYSQLTSSTTNPIRMLGVAFGNQHNTAPTAANWAVDIAIGGSGSETVVIPNLLTGIQVGTDATWSPTVYCPLPMQVPAGTRLSARAQASNTDATDRLLDVMVWGID